MNKLMLILVLILINWVLTNTAQAQLTASDSSSIENLADDVYSVLTVITCQGEFNDLNRMKKSTTYIFYEFGTAFRINSHIIAANHTFDHRALLYRFFDYLMTARVTGDHDWGLIVYNMNEVKIEQTILSYWGAKYKSTKTLYCDWQGSAVTNEKIDKFMASLEVVEDIALNNSFTIKAHNDRLDLALIETRPMIMHGQITFGRSEEITGDDLLIGLSTVPLTVPRSFTFAYNTGHMVRRDFKYSDPKLILPNSAMVLSMRTHPGNSGDPIISMPGNKLIGITVQRMHPWNPSNGVSNRRLIVPVDIIKKFYNDALGIKDEFDVEW